MGLTGGQMQARQAIGFGLTLALLSALLLAGCGVRGSLEKPPGVQNESNDATPGKPGEPVPHRPSILDPLIR
ncbi:MAG TPA: lipoprotein [Hyphomicrobiaceae bacterium]|jgi:predicted small lipoprotein YifL|nr:lipoprotein [Hyphomicrobiaceae bacterium]